MGFHCANEVVRQYRRYSLIGSIARGAMDFFRNRYHMINVILLTIVGHWPYQTAMMWRRFQQIGIIILLISVMIVEGIKIFETRGNVDVLIEAFSPLGVQTVTCAKSINSIVNNEKMKKLLERMKSDWTSLTNEEEIKILEKYAENGRKLCLFYAIFIFGSMSVYLLIPLMPQIMDIIVPLNESRTRIFLYQTEYYIDAESHYYAILAHTYSSTVVSILTIIAIDTMYAAYVQHTCGILAVVGYRFERIAQNFSLEFDAKPAIEDDIKYKELIECIKAHQNAIKFAVLVESSYSTLFFVQLGISMLLISVTLLQLLTKFGQYEEMYRLIQFISAQMFHLFFNSLPGQKLINADAQFYCSVYAAGWYMCSLRTRRLITIVMLRGFSPLKITAGNLYDMSMENFGQVVQTSISYFTVLASLR